MFTRCGVAFYVMSVTMEAPAVTPGHTASLLCDLRHTWQSTGQRGAEGWDCGATSKGLEHPTALWDLMSPTLCSVLDKKEKRQFRSNQLLRKHNLWCSSAFVVLTLLVFQSMMKYETLLLKIWETKERLFIESYLIFNCEYNNIK